MASTLSYREKVRSPLSIGIDDPSSRVKHASATKHSAQTESRGGAVKVLVLGAQNEMRSDPFDLDGMRSEGNSLRV